MIDEDGKMRTENKEKAEVLNNFFKSVLTQEGNSELPPVHKKVSEENSIHTCVIKPEKVFNSLKSLNGSKAYGPDDCLP